MKKKLYIFTFAIILIAFSTYIANNRSLITDSLLETNIEALADSEVNLSDGSWPIPMIMEVSFVVIKKQGGVLQVGCLVIIIIININFQNYSRALYRALLLYGRCKTYIPGINLYIDPSFILSPSF